MITLRHYLIAGACVPHYRRFTHPHSWTPVQSRPVYKVARPPSGSATAARAGMARVLRFGLDLLLVSWALGALATLALTLAALVLY